MTIRILRLAVLPVGIALFIVGSPVFVPWILRVSRAVRLRR